MVAIWAIYLKLHWGMVGWCEGVLYLTAPGRPIDTGLQLGKACYAILVAGKGRRGMFLFLLFLHFHSCSSFFPVLLSSLLLSLLSLFSLSLGDDTKWPTRVDVSLNPNTINLKLQIYCLPLQGCETYCFCGGRLFVCLSIRLSVFTKFCPHWNLKMIQDIFMKLHNYWMMCIAQKP